MLQQNERSGHQCLHQCPPQRSPHMTAASGATLRRASTHRRCASPKRTPRTPLLARLPLLAATVLRRVLGRFRGVGARQIDARGPAQLRPPWWQPRGIRRSIWQARAVPFRSRSRPFRNRSETVPKPFRNRSEAVPRPLPTVPTPFCTRSAAEGRRLGHTRRCSTPWLCQHA